MVLYNIISILWKSTCKWEPGQKKCSRCDGGGCDPGQHAGMGSSCSSMKGAPWTKRDGPHCQAPTRFWGGGKWVVHVRVCLSSPVLWAGWWGQASWVAGLSRTCHCSAADHCGGGRLMRSSNRKTIRAAGKQEQEEDEEEENSSCMKWSETESHVVTLCRNENQATTVRWYAYTFLCSWFEALFHALIVMPQGNIMHRNQSILWFDGWEGFISIFSKCKKTSNNLLVI